jgi:hypothetical protein
MHTENDQVRFPTIGDLQNLLGGRTLLDRKPRLTPEVGV